MGSLVRVQQRPFNPADLRRFFLSWKRLLGAQELQDGLAYLLGRVFLDVVTGFQAADLRVGEVQPEAVQERRREGEVFDPPGEEDR